MCYSTVNDDVLCWCTVVLRHVVLVYRGVAICCVGAPWCCDMLCGQPIVAAAGIPFNARQPYVVIKRYNVNQLLINQPSAGWSLE